MSNSKNIWGKLVDLCASMHELTYVNKDVKQAVKKLPLLEQLVLQLPIDDESVIGAEALAIYYELRDDLQQAIKYRMREVEKMEWLIQDLLDNNHNPLARDAVLRSRNISDLKLRWRIIFELEQKLMQNERGHVTE